MNINMQQPTTGMSYLLNFIAICTTISMTQNGFNNASWRATSSLLIAYQCLCPHQARLHTPCTIILSLSVLAVLRYAQAYLPHCMKWSGQMGNIFTLYNIFTYVKIIYEKKYVTLNYESL